MSTDPATLVITRIVPARLVDAFHGWAEALEISAAAAPGHRASLRLEQAGGVFHLVHQFAGPAERDRWRHSPDVARLHHEAKRFPVERRQTAEGRVVHLVVPSESASSRRKTFLATWIAVFPVLLALSTSVRAVAGDLPQPVQLLFSSLVLTALLQFVILPRVQRLVRPWTLADSEGRARVDRA